MSINKYLNAMSQTETVYWHDSGVASEIEEAMQNGAESITLNPFLTYSALAHDKELFSGEAAKIVSEYEGDKRAEELTKLVCGHYAGKLHELYLTGKPGVGYICAQVNPSKCGDTEYMINQAKSYSATAENICVKLPATKAGLTACKECAALGMNVVMTVGMTVPQALASGEAIQRGHERAKRNGIKPGFGAAVIMVGRLDDYLRDVVQDNGLDVSNEDIILAGAACYKRSIKLFAERGYEAYLMAAAFRGAAQLKELAGSKSMLSVAPKTAKLVENDEFGENISDRPIPADVIARLNRINEFVRAYEPNGMKPEEFITFGPVNRTSTQFIESGWNKMKSFQC